MSKRLWLNLILLVVGAVLVYFVAYNPVPTLKKGQQNPNSLFSIAPYQAEDILIEHKDKPAIVFMKINDQWQLMKPGIAPVNSERIKHLLTILREPIIASYDPEGKDLTPFGLSSSKIKLTINSEEATFGSTNPVTLNRYILKNNTIYTIKEIVYGVLGTSVVSFLTHRLLPEQATVEVKSLPELFSEKDTSFWQQLEAQNIADYDGEETVIGKIELLVSIENQQEVTSRISEQLSLDVLQIEPVLVLGRSDLQVKYTYDKNVLN